MSCCGREQQDDKHQGPNRSSGFAERMRESIDQDRCQRWSHFLRQPIKVDSPMQRTNPHEDAETVFG